VRKRKKKKKIREHRSLPHRYCQAAEIVWHSDFLFDLFFLPQGLRDTAPSIRKTPARPSIPGLTVLLLRRGGRYRYGGMLTRQAEDAGSLGGQVCIAFTIPVTRKILLSAIAVLALFRGGLPRHSHMETCLQVGQCW